MEPNPYESPHVETHGWESDFRFPAIQASIRALGDAYYEDPFQHPGSFCLPVGERPLVGWTPGRIMLVAIVLGFALLGGGVFLGTMADRAKGAGGPYLLALAVCCSVSGIVTFFLPAKLYPRIVGWMMGDRGRALVERAGAARLMAAELSDADRSKMKISIDSDDHVLILCDEKEHRLIIEGLGARYQIRAADTVAVAPFQFMNYVGVEISYRIDPQISLRIAIARVSTLLPVLFFLRRLISNRLLDRCAETLRPAGALSGNMRV